jgi:hypothetical protein
MKHYNFVEFNDLDIHRYKYTWNWDKDGGHILQTNKRLPIKYVSDVLFHQSKGTAEMIPLMQSYEHRYISHRSFDRGS